MYLSCGHVIVDTVHVSDSHVIIMRGHMIVLSVCIHVVVRMWWHSHGSHVIVRKMGNPFINYVTSVC